MKATLVQFVLGLSLLGILRPSLAIDEVMPNHCPSRQGDLAGHGAAFLVGAETGPGLRSEDGVIWTQESVDASANHWSTNYRSAAQGCGVVVVVGCDGQLRTSRDEAHWVDCDSGTCSALHRVAFGNGVFVAVGNEGALVTSTDGIAWTPRDAGTDERLRGVAFGNGRFVVVGYAGVLLTSRDGIRWTRRSSGTRVRLQDVAFGKETFVAVGWHGVIVSSHTGKKWIARPSGTSCCLRRVAFCEGKGMVQPVQGDLVGLADEHFSGDPRRAPTNSFGVFGSGTR